MTNEHSGDDVLYNGLWLFCDDILWVAGRQEQAATDRVPDHWVRSRDVPSPARLPALREQLGDYL